MLNKIRKSKDGVAHVTTPRDDVIISKVVGIPLAVKCGNISSILYTKQLATLYSFSYSACLYNLPERRIQQLFDCCATQAAISNWSSATNNQNMPLANAHYY
ncbi:unnamed protein product [Ceratitis capitata]|uniref:(Mediterranean fruit fly) hypothetical protein n=1 Tax=Ceratitis capitata TaxID=7213 RepID=A0A811U334_CERCA|nr:unnamed protein product [Ceratitis capitata]